MKLYSRKEASHMLCRYHNLDGAESLSGEMAHFGKFLQVNNSQKNIKKLGV